jgi:phosphoglycerate dehydrogenase-like enzyme
MDIPLNVLVLHHEPQRYFETLRSRFPEISFHSATNDAEVAEQMAAVKPQILLSFRCDPISTAAQSMAVRRPCVRWVQVAGAGYDHIGDLSDLSCAVSTCAGVLSRFQAETVMGAMISLNFGFPGYQQQQQQKIYKKLPWRSLEGQRLLLIGFGNIGRAVARNAQFFGMHVTAVRTRMAETAGADVVATPGQILSLLPDSDFVSLHLPYSADTHNFFGAEMFASMKKKAFFINTSRGKLVDEDALIHAIQGGKIAGAYLDVFSQEPLPQTSQLWQLSNVMLTPHYCDSVSDWHERFAVFFADNLQRWIARQGLENCIKERVKNF